MALRIAVLVSGTGSLLQALLDAEADHTLNATVVGDPYDPLNESASVAYVPGTHFFCDGGHENTLRLNFSNSSIAQIHEGMSTLREIFAQALAK